MKKFSFFAVLMPVFLILVSCGTTSNAAPAPEIPQTAEEAVTKTHETVASQIANEINSSAKDEQTDSEPPETISKESDDKNSEASEPPLVEESEETKPEGSSSEPAPQENNSDELELSEKVSDEDSNFDKEREDAPTTDEKNRVSEYPIFEEPEVVVFDLPEELENAQNEAAETEQPEIPAEEEKSEIKNQQSDEANVTEEKKEAEPEIKNQKSETKSQERDSSPAAEPTEAHEDSSPEEETAETEPEIAPSRSVTLKINQYLDVTYPGKGWTYIGETEKDGLLNYFGRKLGSNNTTFSLRAKKAGKTNIHFYKNDALTGEYIDDYLSVTVEDKKGTGRVKAPSYASLVPAQPQRRIERETENEKTETEQAASSQNTAQNPQNTAPQTKTSEKPQETKQEKADQKSESQKETQKQSTGTTVSQNTAQNTAQKKNTQNQTGAQSQSSNSESDVKTVIQNTEPALTNVTQVTKEPSLPQASQTDSQSKSVEYTPLSSQSIQTEESSVQNEPEVVSGENDPWKKNKSNKAQASDESLLEKAKQDFVDGKFEDALKEAQEYYNTASTRLDEALFLLGQISESNSSVKDIRFAVDSYDMLVKRFPASKLWKQAKNRSIYLKRFYIDIR